MIVARAALLVSIVFAMVPRTAIAQWYVPTFEIIGTTGAGRHIESSDLNLENVGASAVAFGFDAVARWRYLGVGLGELYLPRIPERTTRMVDPAIGTATAELSVGTQGFSVLGGASYRFLCNLTDTIPCIEHSYRHLGVRTLVTLGASNYWIDGSLRLLFRGRDQDRTSASGGAQLDVRFGYEFRRFPMLLALGYRFESFATEAQPDEDGFVDNFYDDVGVLYAGIGIRLSRAERVVLPKER